MTIIRLLVMLLSLAHASNGWLGKERAHHKRTKQHRNSRVCKDDTVPMPWERACEHSQMPDSTEATWRHPKHRVSAYEAIVEGLAEMDGHDDAILARMDEWDVDAYYAAEELREDEWAHDYYAAECERCGTPLNGERDHTLPGCPGYWDDDGANLSFAPELESAALHADDPDPGEAAYVPESRRSIAALMRSTYGPCG